MHRPYLTRREFLIGTAGLAGMSLLPRKAWDEIGYQRYWEILNRYQEK